MERVAVEGVPPSPRRGYGRLVLVFGLIGAWGPCQAPAREASPPPEEGSPKSDLTLSYVANSGVLLDSGGTKVLIDALFEKPHPDYRAPTFETLAGMLKGVAPYDGVDLVLVTHDHPDHFDPSLAVRYLEAFADARLAAPLDAVERMRESSTDWTKIEPRVTSFGLEVGEKVEAVLGPVSLTALRTLHGQTDSPMNLMYLLDLEGWRVFHEGDSPGVPEDLPGFQWRQARVDLALVHFWFPLNPECARFLREVLEPDHIALTHLPIRLEGDAPDKIDMVRPQYPDIFLLMPGMPVRTFHARAPESVDGT